jgi:hypothetical protein
MNTLKNEASMEKLDEATDKNYTSILHKDT